MTGNQNITGHIKFLGHVHVRRDFNARLMNGIDPTMMVPLNSKSALTGENFERSSTKPLCDLSFHERFFAYLIREVRV